MKDRKKKSILTEQEAMQLSDSERRVFHEFMAEFDIHCQLARDDKKKMRADFVRAIESLVKSGVSFEEALKRLSVENLGGFYARPPILWYALDDAAKIYPLSMEHGRMTVFRMSAYLKSAVMPEILQMALTFTIKRFPSFATTLKKGFFWHYLNTTKKRYVIEPESDAPCRPLPVSHSFSQSFRVIYFANRISVEFFHSLTDGYGALTFLKVLVSEYLRIMGAETENDGTLWDANELPRQEEFRNEFKRVPRASSSSGFVQKNAVQMSGRLSAQKPCRVLHFKMNAEMLKETAKKYGCTVTVYALAVLFSACAGATDELAGDIALQVPVNMRRLYPSETVRNFAMYASVRVPVEKTSDFNALIGEISAQMQKKTSRESMSEMLTSTENMVLGLSWVPLFIKKPAVQLVYRFLSDRVFTTTLSNIGVAKMPAGYEKYIDSMDFVLGTSNVNRASCAMITFANTCTLSITKMTTDPSFEERALALFEKDGVAVRAEGSEIYEN